MSPQPRQQSPDDTYRSPHRRFSGSSFPEMMCVRLTAKMMPRDQVYAGRATILTTSVTGAKLALVHFDLIGGPNIGLSDSILYNSFRSRAPTWSRLTHSSCPTLFRILYILHHHPLTGRSQLCYTPSAYANLTVFSSGFHRSCAMAVQEIPCGMVLEVSHSVVQIWADYSDWCRRLGYGI